MKQTRKRLSALFLVALMMMTLATTALAENPALPDMTKKGSITLHKYKMDTLPSTPIGDGTELQTPPEGAVPLGGVEFTVTKVQLKADAAEGSINVDDYEAIVGDGAFTATQTTSSAQDATKGITKFADLPAGTYLVHETPSETITQSSEDFLVSIPMTNPEGTGWIYDVHAYPKNKVIDGADIVKSVTHYGNHHETSNINENVRNIISVTIPLDIATASQFAVTDTLDYRLTYRGIMSFLVTPVGKNGTTPGKELTLNTDYTVSLTTVQDAEQRNCEQVGVTFTEAGRAKLNDFLTSDTTQGDQIPRVDIAFCVFINNIPDADIGKAIPNKATLNYTNALGENIQKESNEVEVHTGGFQILKHETGDETKVLSGAKFKLYTSEADALADANAVKNPKTGESWVFVSGDTNGDGVVDANDDATRKGTVFAKGLGYGTTGNDNLTGSTTYYLVEIEAPKDAAGRPYNLLTTPMAVTVDTDSFSNVNKIVKIANSQGFLLPVTGGMGTIIFTVGGLVLMGIAVLIFVKSRKKNTSETIER